jgi:hypothetical protein
LFFFCLLTAPAENRSRRAAAVAAKYVFDNDEDDGALDVDSDDDI